MNGNGGTRKLWNVKTGIIQSGVIERRQKKRANWAYTWKEQCKIWLHRREIYIKVENILEHRIFKSPYRTEGVKTCSTDSPIVIYCLAKYMLLIRSQTSSKKHDLSQLFVPVGEQETKFCLRMSVSSDNVEDSQI